MQISVKWGKGGILMRSLGGTCPASTPQPCSMQEQRSVVWMHFHGQKEWRILMSAWGNCNQEEWQHVRLHAGSGLCLGPPSKWLVLVLQDLARWARATHSVAPHDLATTTLRRASWGHHAVTAGAISPLLLSGLAGSTTSLRAVNCSLWASKGFTLASTCILIFSVQPRFLQLMQRQRALHQIVPNLPENIPFSQIHPPKNPFSKNSLQTKSPSKNTQLELQSQATNSSHNKRWRLPMEWQDTSTSWQVPKWN